MNKKSQNGAGWAKNIAYTLNGRDVHGVVYDARGNGGGGIAPTITGDHNAHISDYTAIVVAKNEREDSGLV